MYLSTHENLLIYTSHISPYKVKIAEDEFEVTKEEFV